MFGYLRGTFLKPKQHVHFLGVGDFQVSKLSVIEDPCPMADAETQAKRRTLNEKERKLYAPMSDLGDVLYDKDAVYVQINKKHINYSKLEDIVQSGSEEDDEEGGGDSSGRARVNRDLGEGQNMMRQLQDAQKSLDEKLHESSISMFGGAVPISASDVTAFQRKQAKMTSSSSSSSSARAAGDMDVDQASASDSGSDSDGHARGSAAGKWKDSMVEDAQVSVCVCVCVCVRVCVCVCCDGESVSFSV
jgi:ribosome biogenesis protein BMS1